MFLVTVLLIKLLVNLDYNTALVPLVLSNCVANTILYYSYKNSIYYTLTCGSNSFYDSFIKFNQLVKDI